MHAARSACPSCRSARWSRSTPSSPSARRERLILAALPAQRLAFLTAQPFAHRGLHGANAVENSRAAFRAAIALGHGIELDVQAAVSGEAFVFHDAELDRLTSASGRLDAHIARELATIGLGGSDETIPRLDEILRLVGGRVPVLIEVKSPRQRLTALCLAVRRALEGYRGNVAVMSFDPRVPRWFREHSERTVRGIVITAPAQAGLGGRLRQRAEQALAMRAARPDFIAHDVRQLPTALTRAARMRGLPVLTWTVRSEADRQRASAHADQMIYENAA